MSEASTAELHSSEKPIISFYGFNDLFKQRCVYLFRSIERYVGLFYYTPVYFRGGFCMCVCRTMLLFFTYLFIQF